jgi:hypothetical protein
MSAYSLLADVIVAVHFGYVAFVILGQLAIMIGWPLGWKWIRNPWFRIIHLTMIMIVVGESMVNYPCPLTTWENDLRALAGQEVDDVSFIGRQLDAIMFYQNQEKFLEGCYYAFGATVLLTLFLVPPRFRKAAPLACTSKPAVTAR